MNIDKKITFVTDFGGDWTALYIDDELAIQNHSLEPEDVLRALGIKFKSKEHDIASIGHCPESLKELTKKKKKQRSSDEQN